MIRVTPSKDPQNTNQRARDLLDAIKNKRFLTLYIEPSSACNLSCTFCDLHNDGSGSGHGSVGAGSMMSTELFDLALSELQKLPYQFESTYFYLHGEPLLNKKTREMIRRCVEANISKKYSMTTNGILLTPGVFDELIANGLNSVTVSLDTISPKTYLRLKGKDSLARIIANLEHVINQLQLNVDAELIIKCIKPSGNGVYDLSEQEMNSVIEYFRPVAEHSQNIHVDLRNEFTWPESHNKRLTEVNHSFCDLPFYQVVLHANGEIGLCCIDTTDAHTIGTLEIDGPSLASMLAGGRAQKIQETMLSGNLDSMPVCLNCDNRGHVDLSEYTDEILPAISEAIMV